MMATLRHRGLNPVPAHVGYDGSGNATRLKTIFLSRSNNFWWSIVLPAFKTSRRRPYVVSFPMEALGGFGVGDLGH
jgi:hypothetical protein